MAPMDDHSSVTIKRFATGGGGGKPSELDDLIKRLDKDGDGHLDVSELRSGLEELLAKTSEAKRLKTYLVALVVVVLVIIGANCGLAFAMADLTQKIKSGNNNALVNRETGVTMRTATAMVNLPYEYGNGVLDTETNITSVLYLVERASVATGCMYLAEGRIDMAVTLLGPPDLYGLFARQATYKMVEGAGCSATGLPEGEEVTAILTWEVRPGTLIWFHVHCPADPPNVNCTVSSYFDALGQSLEFPTVYNDTGLAQEVPGRRRHLLSNRGSLAAAHRALHQGLPESPSHIPLGIIPGLTTRHALALAPVRVPGLVKGEGEMDPSYSFQGRKMHELTDADHAQLRAARRLVSEPVSSEEIVEAACIICTHLASVGYLPSDIAKGDKAFADWTKANWPELHSGYLLYARYVVAGMKQSPTYESLVAQLARPWAEHMAWRMRVTESEGVEENKKNGGAQPSVAGALMMILGVPPTVALGWSLQILPHAVVEGVAVLVVLPAFHVLGAVVVCGQMLAQALMGGGGGVAGMVGASTILLAAAAFPVMRKMSMKV